MSNIESWERQPGEKASWYRRFLIYRNLGASRTLISAANEERRLLARDRPYKPLKTVSSAFKYNAEKHRWRERAEAWDAAIYAEQERAAALLRQVEEEEKQRILTTDYAAKHERVKALARMAHTVEKSFINEDGTINYKFMSPDKLREWRGMLDDIAKELGDRVVKKELAGKDGGPITIETIWGGGAVNEEL